MFSLPTWGTEDFETLHPFICKSSQADISCLEDDDKTGAKYAGKASHDKHGNKCSPWNKADPSIAWTHNYCRNADEEAHPYCYLETGEPSKCNIFQCGAMPKKQDYSSLCEPSSYSLAQHRDLFYNLPCQFNSQISVQYWR